MSGKLRGSVETAALFEVGGEVGDAFFLSDFYAEGIEHIGVFFRPDGQRGGEIIGMNALCRASRRTKAQLKADFAALAALFFVFQPANDLIKKVGIIASLNEVHSIRMGKRRDQPALLRNAAGIFLCRKQIGIIIEERDVKVLRQTLQTDRRTGRAAAMQQQARLAVAQAR